MAMGRPRGEDAEYQMDIQSNHVGPQDRQKARREAEDQMGGLIRQTSWSPMDETSKEQRRVETTGTGTTAIGEAQHKCKRRNTEEAPEPKRAANTDATTEPTVISESAI